MIRFLQRDNRLTKALFVVFIAIASFGIWVFQTLPEARALYFIIAGFHGYTEISALAFVGARARAK